MDGGGDNRDIYINNLTFEEWIKKVLERMLLEQRAVAVNIQNVEQRENELANINEALARLRNGTLVR